MTKDEIIQIISSAHVLADAKLVQHSVPGVNATIARFTPGNASGMKIMAAQMFMEALKLETSELGDEPDSRLFECLHASALNFHMLMLDGITMEALEEEMIADYRKVIARLREVATSLSIAYCAPEDPLLQ